MNEKQFIRVRTKYEGVFSREFKVPANQGHIWD